MTNTTKTLMLAASLTALTANAAPAFTLTHPVGIGPIGDVQTIAATSEKKRVAKRAPAAPTGPCAKAAGVWAWFIGGDIVIRADGSASQLSTGMTATASCSGDQVTIPWRSNMSDELTLSGDGNQLSGHSGIFPVSATRKGAAPPPAEATTAAIQPAPAPSESAEPSTATPQKSAANAKPGKAGSCRQLVGVWTGFGLELVIRPDSTAYEPDPGATGTMTCEGQTVTVHWRYKDWDDTGYTLAGDGNQLNPNTFGDVQLTRSSTVIPAGKSGPPVTDVPLTPLDLLFGD